MRVWGVQNTHTLSKPREERGALLRKQHRRCSRPAAWAQQFMVSASDHRFSFTEKPVHLVAQRRRFPRIAGDPPTAEEDFGDLAQIRAFASAVECANHKPQVGSLQSGDGLGPWQRAVVERSPKPLELVDALKTICIQRHHGGENASALRAVENEHLGVQPMRSKPQMKAILGRDRAVEDNGAGAVVNGGKRRRLRLEKEDRAMAPGCPEDVLILPGQARPGREIVAPNDSLTAPPYA